MECLKPPGTVDALGAVIDACVTSISGPGWQVPLVYGLYALAIPMAVLSLVMAVASLGDRS